MKKLTLALGSVLAGVAVQAQFTPIAVTPDSYNHDLVVEAAALKARPLEATTATLDTGPANTENTYYEQGYNMDAPATGLPPAGTTITSESFPDHSYTFATSYAANNALLVNTNSPTGTLNLTTPSALNSLSFLAAAGNGSPTINYVVHHADGSSETGTMVVPDWFSTGDYVTIVNGRVNVVSGAFQSVDGGNPKIFSVDITLSNTTSPVTRIELDASTAGSGVVAVFAVSGAATAGGEFTPLAVTGFNHDIVVEADAYHPPTNLEATTATMDNGVENIAATFYERGYNTATNATTTGIPTAGSTFTNVSAGDHVYTMAASYTQNNAILVDSGNSSTFRLTSPRAYSALSFLTSAGHGPATIAFTIKHADGSTQSGTVSSADWYNGENPAWIANGRVQVASGVFESVNGNNPRLYSVDIAVDNKTSSINSINLSFADGAADAHAAFFALSGVTGAGAPTVVTHPGSATVLQGGSAQFTVTVTGSQPLNYRWQKQVGTNWIDVVNGGNVSGANTATLAISNVAFTDEANYRAIASNGSGSSTSFGGTLTVLSTGTDVTAATDVIELVGGTTPANEPVTAAIDDTTSKYLNFGTDGDQNSPFVGPVGLVVTPALGAESSGTVVTALRVYAANDAPDRDPINYVLEGSNDDGASFTLISSNSLSLPTVRNAGGLALEPLTQGVQEARFSNDRPYKTYRIVFNDVKNNTAANSVQIGEIELIGTAAGNVASVSIVRGSGGSVTITSTQPGTLQSAASLQSTGTVWTNEGPINGSATVNTTGTAKFYRVLVQ